MPKDLDLPKGCSECRGAPFVVGSSGGAARCTCARGRELYELDRAKAQGHTRPGSPASVAKQRTANRAKSRRDAGKAAANDHEPLFGEKS
jgi:hypothetical protein